MTEPNQTGPNQAFEREPAEGGREVIDKQLEKKTKESKDKPDDKATSTAHG